jgi:hypothetical protein
MGDQAFCYASADDGVRCAGAIGGVDYGRRFAPVAGQIGARQILVSPTGNNDHGNEVCILKTDGTAACMGANFHGEIGTGDSLPTTVYVTWGGRSDLVAFGTGTYDSYCALTTGGLVTCAGVIENKVRPEDSGVHSSFWIDTAGHVVFDDPVVLRPGETRTECLVFGAGLRCGPRTFGTADTVVEGGALLDAGGLSYCTVNIGCTSCWLGANGNVTCARCAGGATGACETQQRFTAGPVLHLATNFYTDSACAILADGSIWCFGSNERGKLGTGDTAPLTEDTQVAPPGSALVRCE